MEEHAPPPTDQERRTRPAAALPGRGRLRGTSIGLRLTMGFGLLLVITALVGSGGWWGTQSLARATADLLAGDGRAAALAEVARARSLELRRYEKDLLLSVGSVRAEEEYLLKWREEERRLRADLAALAELAGPGERARLEALLAGLRTYEEGLSSVLRGVRAGYIRTPQAANTAISEFKSEIASVIDATEDLAARHRGRMVDAGASIGAAARRISEVTLALIVLAVVLGAAAAWLITRSLTRPLGDLARVAGLVAEGDLAAVIPGRTRDELGVLAESLAQMVERLRGLVGGVQTTATVLAQAGGTVAQATGEQRRQLQAQASSTSRTLAAARQLDETARSTSRDAGSVTEAAQRAAGACDAGQRAANDGLAGVVILRDHMSHLLGRMDRLVEQVQQAGEIAATVGDLASQSHVLSLNASLEAARAGEAGLGFDVVAKEIRALALRSGLSAARVREILHGILVTFRQTVELSQKSSAAMAESELRIEASGERLREISEAVSQTAAAASGIVAAAQQQSAGTSQIAEAMRQLDAGASAALDRVRTLEATSEELRGLAGQILALVKDLKT
jgi:methyl-accepting chemotaxis protein